MAKTGKDSDHTGRIADDVLAGLVNKLESLMDAADETKAEIKEVEGEAKQAGFAVKAVRQIVKERRLDTEGRARIEAHEATVAAYRHSVGLFADTPLGRFAAAAE